MKKIFVPIIFVALCGVVKAQQAFTNNGNLQIFSGTSMASFGNFTNSSTGSLVNNGSLYVQGNIKNDQSAMSIGTGTLYLNGSNAQLITGTQILKTNNLVSNNSSGITLNNDLSVSGSHTYSAGLITTSSTPNYLVYEAGSSYTGDDDSKHVNGWVKKYGSTDFTFPVGDATYERTAGLVALSLSSEFNCKYSRSTQNIFNLQGPIVMVDSSEYWDINKVSGGTAQVVLNWDDSKVHIPNWLLTDILVADYTGGLWTNAGGSASGNTHTTGTITSNSKSSFSPFTFGSTSFPLPIKLITFTAEKRTGYVLIKWSTENEQNVNHYEVERSADAVHFSMIGSKNALNLPYLQQYEFEDHTPLSRITYYRLKSIDNDGNYSYSRIVAISDFSMNGNGEMIVLNPAHNAITIINKTVQSGDFDYRLLNMAGQTLQKGILNMQAGSIAVLPVNSATPVGTYMLEIRKGGSLTRTKILLQ